MSDFDTLLDLDMATNTNNSQGAPDPFDPFGPTGTSMNRGPTSGDLLDFGFDSSITTTQNGSSAKVDFEAGTNPLYDFTNSEDIMASESSNLIDISAADSTKDKSSASSNPLYDFMNETDDQKDQDNQVILTNGGSGHLDLLGDPDLMNLMSGKSVETNNKVTTDYFEAEYNVDENGESETDEGSRPGAQTPEMADNDPDRIHQEAEKDQSETQFKEAELISESEGVDQNNIVDKKAADEKIEHFDGNDVQDQVTQDAETTVKEDQHVASHDDEENNLQIDAYTIDINKAAEGQAASETIEKQSETDRLANDEMGSIEQEREVIAETIEQSEAGIDDATIVDQEPEREAVGDGNQEPLEQQAEIYEVEELEKEPTKEQDVEEEHDQLGEGTSVDTNHTVEHEAVEDLETISQQPIVENEKQDGQLVDLDPEVSKEEVYEPLEQEVSMEKEVIEATVDDGETADDSKTVKAEVEEEPVDIVELDPVEMVQEPVADIEPDSEEAQQDAVADSQQITDLDAEEEPTIEEPKSLDIGVDEVEDNSAQRQADGAVKVNGTTEVNENGLGDEEPVRDPNVFRETRDKEEVHFAELNNVRQRFESAGSNEPETTRRQISVKDDYDEGGEYESTPIKDPDVVREGDQSVVGEELPEVGMAKNLLSKFQQMEKDSPVPKPSPRVSPPRQNQKVEYESEPTPKLEQYQGQSESGVFESSPKAREDNVRAVDQVEEEPVPEKGSARSLANRFKEYQDEAAKVQTREKKELTPDRSGKVEYTSEPSGSTIENYEAKTESGVFENVPKEEEGVVKSSEAPAEIMPESGTAKSLLSKFKQFESEVGDKPPPSPTRQREITPDRSGKSEYVSEPRGFLEKYEPKEESGVYENEPDNRAEVVRSLDGQEDVLPEVGTAKKTMERFKEMQKQSSSPVTSQHRQITPPPESIHGKTVSGVLESTPTSHHDDVVRSGDSVEEELPEQGMAKNLLNKFRQIQSESYSPTSPTRRAKEFTPPPESGVYESTPKASIVYEERAVESGVLESTPKRQVDAVREADHETPESELPEKGAAKSMVSKFRQLESESAKASSSTSPKYKEFTPPRDTRGLMSPKSPVGAVSGVQPSELPGQYQQSAGEAGIFENEPVNNPDVYRETDGDWTDGMPTENTTKSMLDKFKAFQQKAIDDQETPKPISRKRTGSKRKDKGMQFAVQSEKCDACGRTVYAMEKMELNNHVYHRNCFKCSHCSARLTPNSFSVNEGIVYCVNHFKQLFARKGNYDEGFGRQQYKKKWQEEEAAKKTASA